MSDNSGGSGWDTFDNPIAGLNGKDDNDLHCIERYNGFRLEMLEDELAGHPEPIVGALLTRAIRAAHRVGKLPVGDGVGRRHLLPIPHRLRARAALPAHDVWRGVGAAQLC